MAAATTAASGSAATTVAARVSNPQPQQNPLRAGNVDDNEHFGDYLTYREKQRNLGIPFRELDPSDRTVVKVVGQDGVPFAGRKVSIRQGQSEVVSLTTTADGTIRFHPKAYQGNRQGVVHRGLRQHQPRAAAGTEPADAHAEKRAVAAAH